MKLYPSELKPIQTLYNGYHFRSRLEARWAVFFDSLKIRYEYESQGFDLGSGVWYLPDFWLPDRGWWVEIKPERTEESRIKPRKLANQSNRPVMIIFGNPWLNEVVFTVYESASMIVQQILETINAHGGTLSADCGSFYYKGIALTEEIKSSIRVRKFELLKLLEPHKSEQEIQSEIDNKRLTEPMFARYFEVSEAQILQAYSDARQARFEFGGK